MAIIRIEVLDALALNREDAARICASINALVPNDMATKIANIDACIARMTKKSELTDSGVPIERLSEIEGDNLTRDNAFKEVQVHYGTRERGELGTITGFAETDEVARTEKEEINIRKTPDAEGTLYDERIHTSKGLKDTQGNWKLKRNIDPDFARFIKSQQPTTQTATATPQVRPGREFAYLIAKISDLTRKGEVTPEIMQRLLHSFGVKTTVELAKKPEWVKQFDAALDDVIARGRDEGDDE